MYQGGEAKLDVANTLVEVAGFDTLAVIIGEAGPDVIVAIVEAAELVGGEGASRTSVTTTLFPIGGGVPLNQEYETAHRFKLEDNVHVGKLAVIPD